MIHFLLTFAHDNPAGFVFCLMMGILGLVALYCTTRCESKGRCPK